jgi:hypothetical protein
MSAEDVKGLVQLLGSGGNVAMISIVWLAYKTRDEFKALFRELIDSQTETRKELEDVKRAIVAKDGGKAAFFEKGG